jgi:hypothetical protein
MGVDVGNNALSLSSRPACWEEAQNLKRSGWTRAAQLPEEDGSSALRAVVVDAMP